jgi:hypothetical protein
MTGRNFDKEFGKIVAVEAAAGDKELRGFYWNRIHPGLPASPEAHELIADEVSHFHDLSAGQYNSALVMCLAGLVEGVKTGREMFSYDG